jgi:hypothetical protein
VAVIACLALVACNRAAVRIPGASQPFPPTPTHYAARATHPYTVAVVNPLDLRPSHYGERVATTR